MKLTEAEEAYTRQFAAEIGADPDALIAEGEQHKEAGYQQAYEAAAGTMTRMGGAGGQMAPGAGPLAEFEPEAGG
jgi:hypothetical protein